MPKEINNEPEDAGLAATELVIAIKRVDAGVRKMASAGLTERALLTLLNDLTGGPKHGVSKQNIKRVLDALPRLKQEYLVP